MKYVLLTLLACASLHAQTNTNTVAGPPLGDTNAPTLKTNAPTPLIQATVAPATNAEPKLLNLPDIGTNWLIKYESYVNTNNWLPAGADRSYFYQVRMDWNFDLCLVRATDRTGKETIFTNIVSSNIVWKAECPIQRHLLVWQTNADGSTKLIGFKEQPEVFKP